MWHHPEEPENQENNPLALVCRPRTGSEEESTRLRCEQEYLEDVVRLRDTPIKVELSDDEVQNDFAATPPLFDETAYGARADSAAGDISSPREDFEDVPTGEPNGNSTINYNVGLQHFIQNVANNPIFAQSNDRRFAVPGQIVNTTGVGDYAIALNSARAVESPYVFFNSSGISNNSSTAAQFENMDNADFSQNTHNNPNEPRWHKIVQQRSHAVATQISRASTMRDDFPPESYPRTTTDDFLYSNNDTAAPLQDANTGPVNDFIPPRWHNAIYRRSHAMAAQVSEMTSHVRNNEHVLYVSRGNEISQSNAASHSRQVCQITNEVELSSTNMSFNRDTTEELDQEYYEDELSQQDIPSERYEIEHHGSPEELNDIEDDYQFDDPPLQDNYRSETEEQRRDEGYSDYGSSHSEISYEEHHFMNQGVEMRTSMPGRNIEPPFLRRTYNATYHRNFGGRRGMSGMHYNNRFEIGERNFEMQRDNTYAMQRESIYEIQRDRLHVSRRNHDLGRHERDYSFRAQQRGGAFVPRHDRYIRARRGRSLAAPGVGTNRRSATVTREVVTYQKVTATSTTTRVDFE